MIQKAIILIWLLLVSLTARSQYFSGGFQLGITANQIDGDGLGGYDHIGVQAGFFTNRPLGGKWAGQLELMYIWRGSREPVSDTSSLFKADLHQISIPVIAQYNYKRFVFEGGLSADINVITKESNLYGDYEPDPPYYPLVLNSILGVSYKLTDATIINLRSHYSLSRIQDGRIVYRGPGLFDDWIKGKHSVTIAMAIYFYF